jgi:NTE family protein
VGLSLDAGVQADLGEIRAGLTLGERKSDTRTGSPLFPTEKTRFTALTGSFVIDQLDALDFPRHGGALALRAKAAREALGGEEDYNRVEAAATQVVSFGPHTFGGMLRLGYSPGSTLPGAELFGLGGFLNLSGYQNDQFLGSELRYGRLVYYNRVMNLPRPLGTGLYAGLSLETGRVGTSATAAGDEPWRKGGSVFLGANTALGPLYLGYGIGEEGNRLLYLFLGRP